MTVLRVGDLPWARRAAHVAVRVARLAWRFAVVELQSAAFAIALFAGIVVTTYVELPLAQYDALLLYVVALTLGFYVAGWETGREVAVIGAFHLLGLALEIYKVRHGSWVYPGDGVTKVAGVPLYAGFMYAAVGSYLCQAWRRFDLRVTGFRTAPLLAIALAMYANFYTHHFWPDLRWVLAALMIVELRRGWVYFTVASDRFRLPLTASFVLIGSAVWAAENLGTFLGAWRYPAQVDVWELVHVGKLGSWALLVSLSFVLVATVKSAEGTLYGHPGDRASVQRVG